MVPRRLGDKTFSSFLFLRHGLCWNEFLEEPHGLGDMRVKWHWKRIRPIAGRARREHRARDRSKGILSSLASSLSGRDGVQVEIAKANLANPVAPKRIANQLQKKRIPIDIRIKCAGFSDLGFFAESDRKKQADMIQVWVRANKTGY